MSTSKPNESAMIMPNILAQNILGVQPMADMINPFSKKWEKIGMDMPTDKWVYSIRAEEIRNWIEDQPIHMWKHYDIPKESIKDISFNALIGRHYIFTEELEAWFQLRWS